MTITIYGFGPSRSFRVLWAAEEAGLDYHYIEMEFGSTAAGGNLNPDYLACNPQGKVPTIVDGDFTLTESAAILNYLAAQSPEKNLLPSDVQARARYDEVCFFILSELEQPLWTNAKHRFALPEAYRVEEILGETPAWEFERAQQALRKLIAGRAYAAGEHFTMADVLLAHTTGWAQSFKFAVADELLEHQQKTSARDAYKRARRAIGKE